MSVSVNGNDEDFELQRKKEEQTTTDIYYLKRSEMTNCTNISDTERQTSRAHGTVRQCVQSSGCSISNKQHYAGC